MIMKRLTAFVLLLACLSAVLPALAESFPFTASAGDQGANLREQPDVGSRILSVIHPGELVTVTGRRGDWYAVAHLGKNGYVHKNKISFFSGMMIDDAEGSIILNPQYPMGHTGEYQPLYEIEQLVRVGKGGANLRSVMDLTAKPVTVLHAGEEVFVYCVVTVNRHDWAVVQAGDLFGYVSASYLEWEEEE